MGGCGRERGSRGARCARASSGGPRLGALFGGAVALPPPGTGGRATLLPDSSCAVPNLPRHPAFALALASLARSSLALAFARRRTAATWRGALGRAGDREGALRLSRWRAPPIAPLAATALTLASASALSHASVAASALASASALALAATLASASATI